MRRLLIGGLLALLPGAVLRAQPLDWPSLPYDYVAQGESLRDVLANFGANYDASVIVSDKVNDQVSGRFDLESPQAFLQLMASSTTSAGTTTAPCCTYSKPPRCNRGW